MGPPARSPWRSAAGHGGLALAVVALCCAPLPYAVFGRTKVARVQGEWAAASALAILGGASPEAIPVTRNTESRAYLNPALASRVGFAVPPGQEDDLTLVGAQPSGVR
jgi:hypothetical protein